MDNKTKLQIEALDKWMDAKMSVVIQRHQGNGAVSGTSVDNMLRAKEEFECLVDVEDENA